MSSSPNFFLLSTLFRNSEWKCLPSRLRVPVRVHEALCEAPPQTLPLCLLLRQLHQQLLPRFLSSSQHFHWLNKQRQDLEPQVGTRGATDFGFQPPKLPLGVVLSKQQQQQPPPPFPKINPVPPPPPPPVCLPRRTCPEQCCCRLRFHAPTQL